MLGAKGQIDRITWYGNGQHIKSVLTVGVNAWLGSVVRACMMQCGYGGVWWVYSGVWIWCEALWLQLISLCHMYICGKTPLVEAHTCWLTLLHSIHLQGITPVQGSYFSVHNQKSQYQCIQTRYNNVHYWGDDGGSPPFATHLWGLIYPWHSLLAAALQSPNRSPF